MAETNLILRSREPDLVGLRTSLETLAMQAGAPRDAVVDMAIALDEIVSNILRCAFPDATEHVIRLRLGLDAEAIDVEIIDDGVPFDPRDVPEPTLDTDIETARVGGRGILFVRTLMDDFNYARVGTENRVRLRRRYKRDATAD